ncbi:MAG: hypothetical protein J6C33_04715 [Lachnospiraceae bacterium]|nr:hypothetical protein [Lachnospiraceae bacterium]
MRMHHKFRNFILYLFLCMILAAGVHDKAASMQKIHPQTTQRSAASLNALSFSQPVDLWTSQAAPRRNTSSITNNARTSRAISVWRMNAYFLFYILTFLSVFSRSNEKIVVFRDSRYVFWEPFTISFMRNADGRKRLFYLPA